MQAPRQHRVTSCAECRRLKLRCDRVFPCSSCQKRGCAAICPDGLLPSRKALREDLSTSTSTFTAKTPVELLIGRIRELEHALATLQATYHTTPHPLLRKELRENANQPERSRPPPSGDGSDGTDQLDQLSENLGTLSMTGYGRSRFFGPTGSTWSQLLSHEKDTEDAVEGSDADNTDTSSAKLNLPSEVLLLTSAFPFPSPMPSATYIGDWLVANLPSSLEAWALCETFFENGAYIMIPLSRPMFIEEVFAFFYRPTEKQRADIPRGHRLAMLLMVFAIGDMLDLTKPAMPTGGKRFYYLARAALALERLYEQPTLTAVQAMILMIVYLGMSDHKENTETIYVLSGVNLKLSMMLGLHRESLKFTNIDSQGHVLEAREQEMRRKIFHEVVHLEAWESLGLGRPSLLNFDHFDCEPPGVTPESGSTIETSHTEGQGPWSNTFIRKCLIPVVNFAVCVKPPPYSAVLELDAVVRKHGTPQHMEISIYEGEGASVPAIKSRASIMLHFAAFSMKELALLYLHRSHFASAMTDFKRDPLQTPFSKSVITSFACACTVIANISMLFEREPQLSVRIWLFWNQLFVPCILGTIVTRSPSCSLAPRALTELDKLCTLLRNARAGVRPSQLLPHVLKISARAHAAYDLYSAGMTTIDASAEVSALVGKSCVSSLSSNTSSPAAAQQPSRDRSSSVPQSQSPTASNFPPQANPAYNPNSNSVSVETVPLTEPLPVGVDMDNGLSQGDWRSFAEFEAFASSFVVQSQPQTQVHSQYEMNPQQTGPPVVYPPTASIDSSHKWAGGNNTVLDHVTDQSYLQNEAIHPALEMQSTWQHFMMQMFGNSSTS